MNRTYTLFTILTFFLLFMSKFCLAQAQIPNGGFEEWAVTDTIPPINPAGPIGWTTSNFLMNVGANQTVFMTDDAAEGNYAARLVSDTSIVSPPFGSGVLDTIAGFLGLGVVNQINLGGIGYDERPDSMSVWIKGIVMPGDTSSIRATLIRFNNNTQSDDTIGISFPIVLTLTDTVYKKVTVPFVYQSSESPELLLFQIGVGGHRDGDIMPGNELFIDDIQLIGLSTSTKQIHAPKQTVRVMPNPFSEQTVLEFENPTNEVLHFTLVNSQGQVVREIQSVTGTRIILQGNSLPKGQYFFTFSNKKELIYTGKLIINK